MSALLQTPPYDHLKPRYSFDRVCRILNCSRDTLHDWCLNGVPGPGGQRIQLRWVPLGRKIEFECEEVERLYQELKKLAEAAFTEGAFAQAA